MPPHPNASQVPFLLGEVAVHGSWESDMLDELLDARWLMMPADDDVEAEDDAEDDDDDLDDEDDEDDDELDDDDEDEDLDDEEDEEEDVEEA
jgi:hypothetical protein